MTVVELKTWCPVALTRGAGTFGGVQDTACVEPVETPGEQLGSNCRSATLLIALLALVKMLMWLSSLRRNGKVYLPVPFGLIGSQCPVGPRLVHPVE